MKEYMHAIPCNKPIIIMKDKAEEFLNMKLSEEEISNRKKREELRKKYEHIVTDNTKK